jgi:hypothetical protein
MFKKFIDLKKSGLCHGLIHWLLVTVCYRARTACTYMYSSTSYTVQTSYTDVKWLDHRHPTVQYMSFATFFFKFYAQALSTLEGKTTYCLYRMPPYEYDTINKCWTVRVTSLTQWPLVGFIPESVFWMSFYDDNMSPCFLRFHNFLWMAPPHIRSSWQCDT